MGNHVVCKGRKSTSVNLQADDDTVGPCIGIYLTEDPRSTTRWEIAVVAKCVEGDFQVGRVLTIGPGSNPTVRDAPSRLVAVANAPGADGWGLRLRAFTLDGLTPVPEAVACEVTIGKSLPQEGYDETLFPGVYPVNSTGTGRQVARIVTAQIALVAGNAVIWAVEQPFRVKARIRNPIAAPASIFIGADQAVTAANGYEIVPGDEYIDESGRQLAVISGVNRTVSTLIEE